MKEVGVTMTWQSTIGLGNYRRTLTWVMTAVGLALPGAAPVTAADISERTPWHITLDEAIVMGMEHGRTSRFPPRYDTSDYLEMGGGINAGDSINARVHVINCAKNAGNNAASPATRFVIAPHDLETPQAEFARSISEQIANVETAYWNLYGSYCNLHSSEQTLHLAHTCREVSKAKYEAGWMPVTEYAQTLEQYEQFRGDRIVALGTVIENERILLGLLGLRMEDGKRLVPVDTPTRVQYQPDWDAAYGQCMSLRPDLIVQRIDLKQKLLKLVLASNQREDANLTDANLTLAVAVRLRAPVRAAKLRLIQSYLQLRDQEAQAERYLRAQYDTVIQKPHEIEVRQHQREAALEQREARAKEFMAGKTTAEILLEAQREWARVWYCENQAVVDYNNALARFEFAKGTLLQHHGIVIAEELPR
jgi:outer membrane protein TolC